VDLLIGMAASHTASKNGIYRYPELTHSIASSFATTYLHLATRATKHHKKAGGEKGGGE